MIIINKSGEKVIDDFIERFSISLDSICEEECVRVFSEATAKEHNLWDEERMQREPMVSLFGNIVYNRPVCDRCGLTREETYALLLHEIGHRVHNLTKGKSGIQLENEIAADEIARIQHGASHLIAALYKIMDYCDLNDCEKLKIQERIDMIKNRNNQNRP